MSDQQQDQSDSEVEDAAASAPPSVLESGVDTDAEVDADGGLGTDAEFDADAVADPDVDIDTQSEVVPERETPAAPDKSGANGVGPFSVREFALGGVWVVAFVVSFFSLSTMRFESVWTAGLLWILTIGVPTAAVFLVVLRRLSPDGIRRVGSLGVDQFASVAFSVSAVLWVQMVWDSIAFAIAGGPWVRSWVMWVELFLMLAGVVLTVCAPLIPVFAEDFRGRSATTAHRNARPINPVTRRPASGPAASKAVAPVDFEADPYGSSAYDAPYGAASHAATAPAASTQDHRGEPSGAADVGAASEWMPENTRGTYEPAAGGAAPTAAYQAFWALAPVERDVVDSNGVPLFRIGPGAWALVIEDHGASFVVRHEDGRVGYLTDVSGVTRG